MLKTRSVNWFDVPVGYKRPGGKTSIEVSTSINDVRNWLSESGANIFVKQSRGFYIALGTLIAGAITSVTGFLKDNPLAKWLGGIVSALGAGLIAYTKLFSVEYNFLDEARKSAILAPNKNVRYTPEKFNLPHEEVSIKPSQFLHGANKNVELKGYFLPSPIDSDKVIIVLNGREHNNDHVISMLEELIKEEVPANYLFVDYPGVGKSTGKVNLEETIDCTEAAYKYLISKKENGGRGFNPENVCVLGASFGGGVALQLANRIDVPLRCLLIQSSFSSLSRIATEVLNIFPKPVARFLGWLLDPGFNSLEAIKTAKAKHILISHGDVDPSMGIQHAYDLESAAKEGGKEAKLLILEGADHTNFPFFYGKQKGVYDTIRESVGIQKKSDFMAKKAA